MSVVSYFLNRIESQRVRARALTTLRDLIALPQEGDIQREQWEALDSQLNAVSNRLLLKLRTITDRFLSERNQPHLRAQLVQGLGELELEITQAYAFFDTFMDMLTQRLSKPIGDLLRGCDVLAADGLRRGFLSDITLPPLVYCDRGFGASTCREGVNIIPGVPNPIPVIGIPYARLVEKYNLISVYHEVGHQALVKLNLVRPIQQVFYEQFTKSHAPDLLRTLFMKWSRELGPDFWAFCLTGMAQTCSLRDILSLSPDHVTSISPIQQHPPAYLRFLASVHWCRHLWGKGEWDDWALEWKSLYSHSMTDPLTKDTIEAAERLLPLAARIFCETRYLKLDRKPLLNLFNLDQVQPSKIKALATPDAVRSSTFRDEPVGVQLAAFRMLRENRSSKLVELDQMMGRWLTNLHHSLSAKN